ncbi:MAG: hypothetical protein GF309_09085 [Candidatus Lokiarchaeota archaeon]|nr:hypothetical protein [Candidatus Lokiarchaeota archaeon]
MKSPTPMYWLLDVEAYDFDVGVFDGAKIAGKALIVSRQLWSVIRGEEVFSALIGPGMFKGKAVEGKRTVELLEPLSALIFNPSELRPDRPVPLVDIISPEVIDPLGQSESEEIVTMIKKLLVEKGNVLPVGAIATVKGESMIPSTVHYDEKLKKLSVRHVSGTTRARFILGGTNSPLYKPFSESFQKLRYSEPEESGILSTTLGKFLDFKRDDFLDNWIIVEKTDQGSGNGYEDVREEYLRAYEEMEKNKESFIFD